jgi:transcriptional regulator GlxA family with amidase domain
MMDFRVLVLEGAMASGVAMSADILSTATALAASVGAPTPSWALCSVSGGPVRLQNGFTVDTVRLPRSRSPQGSVIVVPGLAVPRIAALLQRLERQDCADAARLLTAHWKAGGGLAASCSAVFLLHLAGVLAERRVTTSWWLGPSLAQLSPDCIVDSDRMVSADGPIITAGAAFAQSDLMLYLIAQRFGPGLAESVAQRLLLDKRHAQSHFSVPEVLASGHALVAQLTARLESSLPNVPAISRLAAELCVSERTLSRHVRSATGKSTSGLVQSVKLRRARKLLQSSRMTVEQVALAVGYSDATALRRLMLKTSGSTPGRFRSASEVAEPT